MASPLFCPCIRDILFLSPCHFVPVSLSFCPFFPVILSPIPIFCPSPMIFCPFSPVILSLISIFSPLIRYFVPYFDLLSFLPDILSPSPLLSVPVSLLIITNPPYCLSLAPYLSLSLCPCSDCVTSGTLSRSWVSFSSSFCRIYITKPVKENGGNSTRFTK